MLIINMLIPDLLNILFDQCNYENITTLRSLNKRRTNYANRYSLLRYCNQVENTLNMICKRVDIKAIKYAISHTSICYEMLRWSASGGHVLVVKYLVSTGANIHAYNDHALRFSARYGHLEVVKYLVGVGADIHADEDFALGWSAENGHLKVVKYLISVGANIHANDDGALRWSALDARLEVVKYLLSVGANIHVHNDALLNNKMIKDNFSHLFV